MKYQFLCLTLGLETIALQTNLLGQNPGVKFNEQQLDAIEAALAKNAHEELSEQINNLTKEKLELENANKQLEKNQEAVENSLKEALELNDIKAEESVEKSITALGAKCKEYGASNNRHSFTPTDGNDEDPSSNNNGFIDGYFDPNAEHNKNL